MTVDGHGAHRIASLRQADPGRDRTDGRGGYGDGERGILSLGDGGGVCGDGYFRQLALEG